VPAFLADAFPVEITNHTDWWQPWLPVASAFMVALVAFAGVLISNRTNRRAIDAADYREVEKWRRDTVLRLCPEAVTASLEVESLYENGVRTQENIDHDAIAAAIRKIGPVHETINLIGITSLTELGRRLEEACNGIKTFADDFVVAQITCENRLDQFKKDNPEAASNDVAQQWNDIKRNFFFQPEAEFAAAMSRMSTVRGAFIQEARNMLNQTSAPATANQRWYLLWLR
jgi:hypothetical protein